MKRYLLIPCLLLLAAFCGKVHAAPTCVPWVYGEAVAGVNPPQSIYYDKVDDGESWVYFCRGPAGEILPQYLVCAGDACLSVESVGNNLRAIVGQADTALQVKVAWRQAMTLNLCESQLDPTSAVWRVCQVKNATTAAHSPAPVWKVKVNAASGSTPQTRPVRAIAGGVLGPQLKDAAGKPRTVPVGTPCMRASPGIASAVDEWLPFGPDPGAGALCSKS